MDWKDILVFADASANGLARASMAGAIADEMGAHLAISVPVLAPRVLRDQGEAVMTELTNHAVELARADAGRVLSVVRADYLSLEPHISVDTPEVTLTEAPALTGRLGQCADLVVVGQPIAEDCSALDEALLQGALLSAGCGCLMAPRWNQTRAIGTRILIAWKEGREAARAVHDAMPLLRRAQTVHLWHDRGEGKQGKPADLTGIVRYLAHHGIVNLEVREAETRGDVGLSILEAAREMSADLIVMGGYGHARAIEWTFGGATRTLIAKSPIAVFFSH